MNENFGIARSRLPSVDQVLRSPGGRQAEASFGHLATVAAIRRTLAAARISQPSGQARSDAQAMASVALRLLVQQQAPSLRRVINLTGTVLHTNLGRAVLPEAAIEAAREAMRSAVALEFDLGGAVRGERDNHVRGLIRELTGAEDATIVNNNAAALLLALNTFALRKDAIVSRGELIEIGGAFRLPDIMARGGARLVEVGTTNRTHLKDYAQAIGARTGMILKVHTSNYVIQGFTKSVSGAELAALARAHKVPFIHDLGSGALVDLTHWGQRREPTVRDALADADLVTFSGDKLLGGPQAGIVAGAKALVARMAANPMKRALRVDKIRLAALEAVLKLYRDPGRLAQTLPTLGYFARSREDIAALAARLLAPLADAVGEDYATSVVACMSQIGSGALPLETLASAGIAIRPVPTRKAGTRLAALTAAFRGLPVPVLGRVKEGALVLDLRCLDDEGQFLSQLKELWASPVGEELPDVPA